VADALQFSLLGEPEPLAAPAPARESRLTSKGIAPGDIVEVDRKGRRFHALVESVEQRETGRFDLAVRPLDGRSTWRTATVRDVVGVWRRARGSGELRGAGAAAPSWDDEAPDDVPDQTSFADVERD
jgi:hypothetical protein